MKHFIFTFFFLACFSITTTFALDASVTYTTFKGESQNYVEVNLFLVGSSVHYKTFDKKVKAAIETVIIFKQGDKIIKFDKFTLNSPPIKKDSVLTIRDFANIKRYALENGEYEIEVSFTDLYAKKTNTKEFKNTISINYAPSDVAISDLQPIDKYINVGESNSEYVKNGFLFETHPFGFYSKEHKFIKFYTELYNTDKIEGAFYTRYFIKQKGSDDEAKPLQMRAKKLDPRPVHALILQLSIMDIPSGDYELVIELRNSLHKVISSKRLAFERSNPFLNRTIEKYEDIDFTGSFVEELTAPQLNYSLRAISPQMPQTEVGLHNSIVKSKDSLTQRKYLFNYWIVQDAQQPHEKFKEYMKKAQLVDNAFRSAMELGFETDRGYIYLKYGKPNDILREVSDPTAPPYQVWKYYELEGQQDVKFVFANPTLAVNDFKMIHSTLRGELNNPNWLRDLYEKSPIKTGNYIDNPQPIDQMGRNADRIINQ